MCTGKYTYIRLSANYYTQILENVLKYIYISMKCTWTESDLDTESSLRPCQKCLCRPSGYAKSGSRLCQIRLKNMPNQAHMPHKCAKSGIQGQIRLKSGNHYQTHWKENPIILSTPVSDKGIGHTYNEEKQTRGQNAEAERSIIGCETVKIRARTPFGFNESKHIEINWRIILVNETAQKISLPGERSRNPLPFQGNTMQKQT